QDAVALLHIVASLIWVAGGVATVLTGTLRKARASADEQVAQLKSLTFLGIYFFFPAMVIAVGTGLAMVMTSPGGWQPFAILGLIGVAATLAFNALILHPTGRRAVAIARDRGTIAALVELKRFSRLAKFDLALRVSVVAVMLLKPHWTDLAALGVLAVILAIGALISFAE
ncbi:MAG: hypothetical protein JNN02_10170, partial [Tabrizicola sp.]|nr:hypothetical protein [Tabrizicola sp.]